MQKNLTELVFILDRSGSMGGLEDDTIGGYNAMLKKHQETEGEAFVSTILFDDQVEILHDRLPVKEVKPLTNKEYFVRGCTALLDAIGFAIQHITEIRNNFKEEDIPEKTIFVITTDGMENASKEYRYNQIRKMIEKKQAEENWEFLFLGANIDAVSEAGKLGIQESNAVKFHNDSAGVTLNYRVLAEETCNLRKSPGRKLSTGWKKAIEEDYEKRK